MRISVSSVLCNCCCDKDKRLLLGLLHRQLLSPPNNLSAYFHISVVWGLLEVAACREEALLARGAVSSRVGSVCWDLAQCHFCTAGHSAAARTSHPRACSDHFMTEIPGAEEGFERPSHPKCKILTLFGLVFQEFKSQR